MLIVIVSTGSALLLLNLMVIICFCNMRRHRAGNDAGDHPTLPRMDSVATATTQGSTSVPRFEVETEKAAAFKQIMVEVNSGEGRRAVTTSSAESVSSVIDLTRMRMQHRNHLHSAVDRCDMPPTSLPLTEVPCRPALSLGDLAPHTFSG